MSSSMQASPPAETGGLKGCWQEFKLKVLNLLLITVAVVIIEIPAFASKDIMNQMASVMGIRPRYVPGLTGVPLHPWLHFGWAHLSANLAGLWLLGGCVLLADPLLLFWCLWGFVTIVGGFLVWAAAFKGCTPEVCPTHAGMSGVLFGMFGYLIVRLWWERPVNWKAVIATVIAAIVYGVSILTSFFTFKANVSWEGHLYGFLSGILFAFLYFKVFKQCVKPKEPSADTSSTHVNAAYQMTPPSSVAASAPHHPFAPSPAPSQQAPPTSMWNVGWGSTQVNQSAYAYGQNSGSNEPSWAKGSSPAKPGYAYV